MKAIYTMYLIAFMLIVGWVMNVVKVITIGFAISEWGGMQVVRVVGIFIAPLGAVIGWF
jgi:hypothetical protein